MDSCDTNPNVKPDAAPAIPSLTAKPNLPDFLYSSIPADIPSKIPIAAVTASPMPGMNLAPAAAPRSNPLPTFAAPLTTPPAPRATAPAPLATALAPLLASAAVLAATLVANPPIAVFSATNPTPILPRLSNILLRNPPFSSSLSPPNPPSTNCCNKEVCFSCSPSCASEILLSSAASSTIAAPLGPGFARVGFSGIFFSIEAPKSFNALS